MFSAFYSMNNQNYMNVINRRIAIQITDLLSMNYSAGDEKTGNLLCSHLESLWACWRETEYKFNADRYNNDTIYVNIHTHAHTHATYQYDFLKQ